MFGNLSSGLKTSEFIITIVLIGLIILQETLGLDFESILAAVGAGTGYTISRGLSKSEHRAPPSEVRTTGHMAAAMPIGSMAVHTSPPLADTVQPAATVQ